MTIYFTTPGSIDLEAAFTFGMSAKTSENAIGFFGTGLKFAIATLLRTGHKVTISVNGKEHKFAADHKDYRGKTFSVVTMNNESMGFTTDLGKLWEIWMAFRELHSNTLDEGGTTSDYMGEITSDCTVICVEGAGIDQAYKNRGEVFVSAPVIEANDIIEVREGQRSKMYYRGVRAMDMRATGIFTYNILEGQTLTEDRTLKYDWMATAAITRGIAELKDIDVLRRILCCPVKDTFEFGLDFDAVTPSEQFLQVCRENIRSMFLNPSARRLASRLLDTKCDDVELDPIQDIQMKKAIHFLTRLGFDVQRYPIVVRELYGPHGLAKNGTIFIAPQCFREGTKYLAATIYEEFLHLSEGVLDETRQMQNMLFNQIMTMGERILGEPL